MKKLGCVFAMVSTTCILVVNELLMFIFGISMLQQNFGRVKIQIQGKCNYVRPMSLTTLLSPNV